MKMKSRGAQESDSCSFLESLSPFLAFRIVRFEREYLICFFVVFYYDFLNWESRSVFRQK